MNIYSQARNSLGSFISEERRSMARSMAWIERHIKVLVTTVGPKRGVILCSRAPLYDAFILFSLPRGCINSINS